MVTANTKYKNQGTDKPQDLLLNVDQNPQHVLIHLESLQQGCFTENKAEEVGGGQLTHREINLRTPFESPTTYNYYSQQVLFTPPSTHTSP